MGDFRKRVDSSHRIARKRHHIVQPFGKPAQPLAALQVSCGGRGKPLHPHSGTPQGPWHHARQPSWLSIPKGGQDILFPSFGIGALEDLSSKQWVGNPHSLCVSLASRNGCPHPDRAHHGELPQGSQFTMVLSPRSGNWVANKIKQTIH